MQKLIIISVIIAIFVALLLAYFYLKPKKQKPKSVKGLVSGKSYTIQHDKLYLNFDTSKDFTNMEDFLKNILLGESQTAWTLERDSDQTFRIFFVDVEGAKYYLFPFNDQQLGCTKIDKARPLESSIYYTERFLSFAFELQKDNTYIIKWIGYKSNKVTGPPLPGYLISVNYLPVINDSVDSFTWKINEIPSNIVDSQSNLPLVSGQTFIIEHNSQYLNFDSNIRLTDIFIIENVFMKSEPTTWTLELVKDQIFRIFCVDKGGSKFYLFPFNSLNLGCTKISTNHPLESNEWNLAGMLSFAFYLQKDNTYLIKWIGRTNCISDQPCLPKPGYVNIKTNVPINRPVIANDTKLLSWKLTNTKPTLVDSPTT